MTTATAWVVVKFGGTSVSDLASWSNIKTIVQQHLSHDKRVLLVCSAPHRISDHLCALLKQASNGEDYEPLLTEIQTIYHRLCDDLAVDAKVVLHDDWASLTRCIQGVALLNDASAKSQAKLMSFGERLLTRLACAYLHKQQLPTTWVDAVSCLQAQALEKASPVNHYLNAQCVYEKDPALVERLLACQTDVVITQGFIAGNESGEVVLLGRGGSDISAAYFSAKLQAACCEIWTDVPGIYTANPRRLPEARQVMQLSYEEAQEIALMGAEVLHPRTLAPLWQQGIPLWIRHTRELDRVGTLVCTDFASAPAIKAVSVNRSVVVLSIEALGMWQQSGFLADIFLCFKRHHISIDLISTSQANVTVSLDSKEVLLDTNSLERLIDDLKCFATVQVIRPCATLSVVGCQIRKVLYQISALLSLFRTLPVHLLSQAANDLSFTVVVDEGDVDRLEQRIHELLVEHSISQSCFGLSYYHEFIEPVITYDAWWHSKHASLIEQAKSETPLYLYDQATLEKRASELKQCRSLDAIFYAMKANANPDVLRVFYQEGLGFECVSIYEVRHVFALFPEIDRKRLLFTPNFAAKEEYQEALDLGIYVIVDNLHPLTQWPDIFRQQAILLRMDPGYGQGHHQFVETGGNHSKFGIAACDLARAVEVVAACDVTVIGLHAHSGSGVMNTNNWAQLAKTLMDWRHHFTQATIINIGGGLGIPEKPQQKALDLNALDQLLQSIKQENPGVTLWIEPGRFLTAEAGVLLARVTQTKQKGSLHYIGIDAGMHTLMRPVLYGAYHPIVNLTRWGQPCHHLAHIVGPICESGDVLGRSRWMPETSEGDVILIANVGAYGASMSSTYNLRPKACERVLGVSELSVVDALGE